MDDRKMIRMPKKDTEKDITALLKEKQLRSTEIRREILHLFVKYPHALSHGDITDLTGQAYDRVTLYRTLNTFVEKGLIHEIIDHDSKVKYNLCQANCEAGHHHDNHLHFKCNQCEHTFCLTHSEVPRVEVPENYQVQTVDVLLTGLCPQCAA
jgi:Fur family ferric uptake transcriptional regulator